MPTIQLPTSPSTALRRNERTSRRRARTSLVEVPTTPPQSTNRPRRRGQKSDTARRSIHSSSPPVADRESSLYPHRVYASPGHDWDSNKRSLKDFSLSTPTLLLATPDFYRFGLEESGTESIYGSASGNLQQHRSLACLGVYNTTPITTTRPLSYSNHTTRSQWLRSTVEDDSENQESDGYLGYNTSTGTETETETDLERSRGSSLSDHSYQYNNTHYTDTSHGGIPVISDSSKVDGGRGNKKWFKPFSKIKDLKLVQKVSHDHMTRGKGSSTGKRPFADPVLLRILLEGFSLPHSTHPSSSFALDLLR